MSYCSDVFKWFKMRPFQSDFCFVGTKKAREAKSGQYFISKSGILFLAKKKNHCTVNIVWDCSVGIATGYGLDDRMIAVRFSAGAGTFSVRHHVQTISGAHPAPYPIGIGGSFSGC
jgi:hypothetical protein